MTTQDNLSPVRWRKLVACVDELLLSEWDPIGVGRFEGAFDEYSSYAPGVARYALRGNAGTVADHLARLRTQSMGLQPKPSADLLVAERLVAMAMEVANES